MKGKILSCGYDIDLLTRDEMLVNEAEILDRGFLEDILELETYEFWLPLSGDNPTCTKDFKRCPYLLHYDSANESEYHCHNQKEIASALERCVYKSTFLAGNNTTFQGVDETNKLYKCMTDCDGTKNCDAYMAIGKLIK